MFSHCLIQLLLICALSAGQEMTLLDKCCPKAKVDGVQYGLIYPNNTNGLANACESSCPYLLDGAEDSLEAKCFNTVVNKDICVFPRPLKRNQKKKAIFMGEVQPKKILQGPIKSICGWVFQHWRYYGTSGYTRESVSGNFNHHFNDQISSVKVECGCEMHLFRDFDLKGPSVTYSENTPWVGWSWNDKFSSFKCTCNVEPQTCLNGCCWKGPSRGVEKSGGKINGVGWPVKASTVEDCAKRCSDVPQCRAFHFYGHKDNYYKDCYLHKYGEIGPQLDDGRDRYAGSCPKTSG